MSVTRACLPCRAAKAKCDLIRPTCGRCNQRGLTCSGFPADAGFIFRDENETAQRNSQRARKEWRRAGVSGSSNTVHQQVHVATDVMDDSLQLQYPWLNERAIAEVPGPLKRDLETRAVERFFINWTLNPSNHGASPGHMHNLPMLYLSSAPDSILWLAIRAVAFADMKNENAGNVSFHVKARQHYGASLNRMRTMINDQQDLSNDSVLSAVILIDNFELIYLARNNPLGPHNEAIKQIMHTRGDMQLYHPTRFSLWRMAHYRLQFWQTLLFEQPDPEQIAWVNKLNVNHPDLHICADVLHMNTLSAMVKMLTRTVEDNEAKRAEKLEQARQLAQEILDLTVTTENWTSEMTGVWKPKIDDLQNIMQPQDVGEPLNFPIPHFPFPQILSYDDIWLAYICNFYAASQIVLRESLVDIINYIATIQAQDEHDMNTMAIIQKQRDWVNVLSTTIIRSFPMLLGFTYKHELPGGPKVLQQGKMAGRLFSLFSMWVVQRSSFTSAEHKQTANEVIAWINSRHELN